MNRQSRGLAMGAYTAFLDLAQGLASPALGLVAGGAGLNIVFFASAIIVLCAAFVASWLMAHPPTTEVEPTKWDWRVYEGDTPLKAGLATTRETAQIEGNSALFRLLSVG